MVLFMKERKDYVVISCNVSYWGVIHLVYSKLELAFKNYFSNKNEVKFFRKKKTDD